MRACGSALRERVRNKDLLIFGAIVDSRSGAPVELYQDAGYDVLLIDREHTALNSETILEHIRLARALGFPCVVRVADDSYHELNRTLDQAPDGIFVPRVRTRAQVEQILRTVTYPPQGIRGLAGSTCPVGRYYGWDSVTEQIATVSANLVVGIQIETREALEDLDGILSVPGVDIAVVGGDDLSLGMGIPGEWTSDAFRDAVEQMIAACQRHDVLPGIACGDPATAAYWIGRGMCAIWYATEIMLFWNAAVEHLARLQEMLANVSDRGEGPQDCGARPA